MPLVAVLAAPHAAGLVALDAEAAEAGGPGLALRHRHHHQLQPLQRVQATQLLVQVQENH